MTAIPPTPPPLPQPPPGPSPGFAAPTAPGHPPIRQSFGEQAARFSLYVPLAAILLGCLSRGGDEAGVAMAIGLMNLILIVAGFVLGIAALVSMLVYGRQRILARALVGVLVNGVFLVSAATLLLPAFSAKRVRDQVVGRWQLDSQAGRDAPPAGIDVDLKKDGTFRLTRHDGAGGVAAAYSGNWGLDRKRTLGVKVQRVEAGDPSVVGETLALGVVKSVDGRRLVLKTDAGDDVLRRLP